MKKTLGLRSRLGQSGPVATEAADLRAQGRSAFAQIQCAGSTPMDVGAMANIMSSAAGDGPLDFQAMMRVASA
jgi:hypothetical protein